MEQFLKESSNKADVDTKTVVEFLLEEDVDPAERAARLVHGTLSYILSNAAANGDVLISPKPTLIYKGASNLPMLHFAYEVTPVKFLAGSRNVWRLLTSPILRVSDPPQEPWFELLPAQPPGQTEDTIRTTLNFLGDHVADTILLARTGQPSR